MKSVSLFTTGRSSDGNATCRRVVVGGKYLARTRPPPPPPTPTPPLPPRPTRSSGYRRARARTRDECEREPETNSTDSTGPLDGAPVSQCSNVIPTVRARCVVVKRVFTVLCVCLCVLDVYVYRIYFFVIVLITVFFIPSGDRLRRELIMIRQY